jgi:Transglycosylase SLT domain
MQFGKLALIYLFTLWFTVGANAQLAQPDAAGERDGDPADAAATTHAGDEPPQRDDSSPTNADSSSICQAIASAATANRLPLEFFVRVIWQESRFKADAVGPLTRGGQRAQGIAQFMPATAAERLLHNPFDPAEALTKSAAFLRELQDQFGNLGLAAAAYNAGPQRVRDWLVGKRFLPAETETYVRRVTGRSAQQWARSEQTLTLAIPQQMSCTETAKLIDKPGSSPPAARSNPTPAWVVQLAGDRSEIKAVAAFRQLQKMHEGLLAAYEPVIVRTTLRAGADPVWTRVRIDLNGRQAAETLCSRLRAVGEECLVQRN